MAFGWTNPLENVEDEIEYWANNYRDAGRNESVGFRLAANLGEETFFQVGGQVSGIINARSAVNVALGRSLIRDRLVLSGYAGPLVASGGSAEAQVGALGAVRADVRLLGSVGVGAELQANWAAGNLAGNAGLYLTFGGFER